MDTIQLGLRKFPRAVYQRLKQAAAQRGMTMTDFVVLATAHELERPTPLAEPEIDLHADLRWFEAHTAELERSYPTGTYLAIVNHAVVDHDTDVLALTHRVRERLGRRSILMPRLGQHFEPTLVRSPRRVS